MWQPRSRGTSAVPFAYLRDPLFLLCLGIYFAHRWAVSQGLSTPWLRSYVNDLICLPFWVPMMLWLQRVWGLRNHDDPPQPTELVIPLLIWATVFEVMLPSTRTWSGLAFPDPADVLCYALGGLVSVLFWNWWYRPRTPRQ